MKKKYLFKINGWGHELSQDTGLPIDEIENLEGKEIQISAANPGYFDIKFLTIWNYSTAKNLTLEAISYVHIQEMN
jgi:hypothetical protein